MNSTETVTGTAYHDAYAVLVQLTSIADDMQSALAAAPDVQLLLINRAMKTLEDSQVDFADSLVAMGEEATTLGTIEIQTPTTDISNLSLPATQTKLGNFLLSLQTLIRYYRVRLDILGDMVKPPATLVDDFVQGSVDFGVAVGMGITVAVGGDPEVPPEED